MKEKMKSGILVFVGITLVAIAISMFFVPNKIVNGGTSGLSTIIYYTIGLKPSIANAITAVKTSIQERIDLFVVSDIWFSPYYRKISNPRYYIIL